MKHHNCFVILLIIAAGHFQAAESCAQHGLSGMERRSLLIASQRYPDLQREGTRLYAAYNQLLMQAIEADSVVFSDPNWPLIVAERARENMPAMSRGATRVGRTQVERYEDALEKMANSSNAREREYARVEMAAYRAELADDHALAAQLRVQLAQLQALGRIEALLMSLDADIWRIKQRLGVR